MSKGKLIIVGTGIYVGHLTEEARGWIEIADKILYCIADAATERLIHKLNPRAETLYVHYDEGKPRRETYRDMTNQAIEAVRSGRVVCMVFYGHPGVFVNPSRAAMTALRREKYEVKMLPAISSIDCLFADLDVDPCSGCQIFEATDLVLRQRLVDIYSHVIVLQVPAIGELGYSFKGWSGKHVRHLRDHLQSFYPSAHEVTFYEAPQYPLCDPLVQRMELKDIADERLPGISTLYIPPRDVAPIYIPSIYKLEVESILDEVVLIPSNEGQSGAST